MRNASIMGEPPFCECVMLRCSLLQVGVFQKYYSDHKVLSSSNIRPAAAPGVSQKNDYSRVKSGNNLKRLFEKADMQESLDYKPMTG
ncbi:hypothetical protein ACFTAO_21810 [Paenibacillus rhizoplanae]